FQNESSVFTARSDKLMWITHPESPVTIKDDLMYFWDKKYLPDPESTRCSHFVTSNSMKPVTLCKVKGMERCSRRIDMANELRFFSFYSSNEPPSFLTSFAWLCPNSTVCCEWECCTPHHYDFGECFLIFLLIFFGVILVVSIIFAIAEDASKNRPPHYTFGGTPTTTK
ncbi:hypothetical protein PMAYCL1PPCAC_23249, partial [Pristionchus mayeri]